MTRSMWTDWLCAECGLVDAHATPSVASVCAPLKYAMLHLVREQRRLCCHVQHVMHSTFRSY